jgi:hypothetical protein
MEAARTRGRAGKKLSWAVGARKEANMWSKPFWWLIAAALVACSADVAQQEFAASDNGRAGTMSAFYDGQLFTINFKELPSGGEASNLAHNGSINTIYQCDACAGLLPGGGDFMSVLDAIQGDGFNPLWQEVQITFNAGHAPMQLTSDNDVLAAANAGVITLAPTTEVYRCAVLGPK